MKREINSFFSKLKELKEADKKIYAPVTGTSVPVTEVQDEVFSRKMLGDGVAIKVSAEKEDMVVSPVKGKILFVADTIHGIGITTNDGAVIMIHIGIDTVSLNGSGFSCKVKEGQRVEVGTPLCLVDFPYIKERNCETDVIVVMPDEENSSKISRLHSGVVTAGKSCILEYD